MKKLIFSVLLTSLLFSCAEKEVNFTLTGNVKNLKKGKLYLQKIDDTLTVNVDSVNVDGNSEFRLETFIKEPEILFLYLDKASGDQNDNIVEFFAEEGEMQLETSLKNFESDAVMTGSKNQEKLDEYKKTLKRFNNQHLDLLKENLEAQRENDEERIIAVNKKYENLLKRKYLFTINYAINNKEKELAPYLMLKEGFDANTKYLDTVYKSLERPIKKSKYGKELKKLIKEREKLDKLDKKVQKK